MAGRGTGVHSPTLPGNLAGELVGEWCGPHVLIRNRGEADESSRERRFLATIPGTPGDVLVLASVAAHRDPMLRPAVRSLLAVLRARPGAPGPRKVWLAVSGLGSTGPAADWLRALSVEFGVDVMAPQGVLTNVAGCGLYVGDSTGATGWLRFAADDSGSLFSTRYPVPSWEFTGPRAPLTAGGLVAEPVPAGLFVRDERAPKVTPRDPAFSVPGSWRHPKLIVGRPAEAPPAAAAVAAVLAELPVDFRSGLVLLPGNAAVTKSAWVRELAGCLRQDIVLNTGTQVRSPDGTLRTVVVDALGEPLTAPFPTVIRQRPTGEQQVLDIAAAPAGWVRCGPRHYRMAVSQQNDPDVVAEVVPGGLALRPVSANVTGSSLFEPLNWSVSVGVPGGAVTGSLLTALAHLLDGLTQDQRRTVLLRVLGRLDDAGDAEVARLARNAGVTLERPPRPAQPPAASPAPAPPKPVVTVSAAPVATMSGPVQPPASKPRPDSAPVKKPAAEDPAAELTKPVIPALKSAKPPAVSADELTKPVIPALESAKSAVSSTELTKPVIPALESTKPEPASTDPAPADPPAEPTPDLAEPVILPERPSTAAQQAKLAASAGSAFTEALATVNAALATWPTLRHDESGAKADYVAVCLYLGRSEAGAVRLNEALRAGRPTVFDSYLPCLASGLRRLPTHRRALLRQGSLGNSAESPYPAGAVLTERGFLSASVALDVTVPTADLDMLIWPHSARRTSELAIGRPIDEAVFLAGPRFKALAVRTAEDSTDDEDGDDDVRFPRTAVLIRELLPEEDPATPEAESRDRAALAKLERAWKQRCGHTPRVVHDPDAVARLTTPMITVMEQRTEAMTVAATS